MKPSEGLSACLYVHKTETHTPNDEYENFVNAHLEAATKYIPT